MPTISDFRLSLFDSAQIDKCGKHIGRKSYWKLYSIENFFRIIIHSVLSIQISADWWNVAVDKTIRDNAASAERFRQNYLKKPWHGKPGAHGIYYINLSALHEIIRTNANFFYPIIPNLEKWMLGIEELRLPRNLIAHMNFPSNTDMKRIDVFYDDCGNLIALVKTKVDLIIP